MSTTSRFGLRRMLPRDPAQPHRAASGLELLFDLVIVVAVSVSSSALRDLETHGELGLAVLRYAMIFFAIWWAWMNFTWFASSFDTDDWLYRVMTIVQMAGTLVVAAGAGIGIGDGDFTWVALGYVLIRLVAIPQWLRVAHSNPEYRGTALRYAAGIAVVQTLWVLWVVRPALLPSAVEPWLFAPLAVGEMLVPPFAESARPTPWHPEHLTERYGLFTIILLGESVLAAATAVIDAIQEAERLAPLVTVSALGLVLIAALWWIYFARPMHEQIAGLRSSMTFGYFHLVIFAAAGAVSAGLEVTIGLHEGHDVRLPLAAAQATLSVPVALFLLGVWWLALRSVLPRPVSIAVIGLAALVALSALLPWSIAVVAAGAAATVVVLEVAKQRAHPAH